MGLLTKIKSFVSNAASTGTSITEAALKRGGDFFKKIDNPTEFKKVIQTPADARDLMYYVGKNADSLTLDSKQLNTLGQAFNVAKKETDIVTITGKSVGESGKALTAAKDFFKRNEKTLLAAGLTVGAIATLMLLTGKRDPAEAIGEELGNIAGGIGSAAGEGLKDLASASGITDFFKNWGLYIGIFCAILLMLGVFMMLK